MSTSRFTPANHLLPTLFDRLCDNAPYQKIDRDISVTPVQLKEIIRRDLSFLLNTISHEGDIDARRYPGVDPAAAQSHPAGWRTGTGGNAHTTGRTERNLV